jgi:hypothetical protein
VELSHSIDHRLRFDDHRLRFGVMGELTRSLQAHDERAEPSFGLLSDPTGEDPLKLWNTHNPESLSMVPAHCSSRRIPAGNPQHFRAAADALPQAGNRAMVVVTGGIHDARDCRSVWTRLDLI